ncbi:sensor histidine kinase [Cohnella silvisoli]|uniref:Histidine kinase n=1 Tax=Cohnella silvisoli TaxID=2873699 RepID=A0ABV1KU14_9BACL|nr:histidine kinase [Cohnella silvisoli]MCD9023240.1 histidine kinase [Cohnella silvisoli]
MLPKPLFHISILPKLLGTFLLIIVPLYVISLRIHQIGESNVKKEISLSMSSRIAFYMQTLEAEIGRIKKLQNQYMIDDDINNLSAIPFTHSFYENMLAQQRIQAKLNVLKSSSLYVKEAFAYIPAIKKTIYTYTIEDELPQQQVKELAALSGKQTSPFVYWDHHLYLNVTYPDPRLYGPDPMYIIQVQVDEAQVSAFLNGISNYPDAGAMLFNREQGWRIMGHPNDSILDAITNDLVRPMPTDTDGKRMTVQGQRYLIFSKKSDVLDATLVTYVPEKLILGSLRTYQNWFWVLSGASLLIVIVFSYHIYRVIHAPLRKLVTAFRRLESGDANIEIRHRNHDEFEYLYTQFNSTTSKMKQLISEVYESRLRSQRSELKQLQSQINPHFLYNTYFMIHRMAKALDVDNLLSASQYLGEYFRFITRNTADEVTLEEEVGHTMAYIRVQMLRFSNRIRTEADELPEDCRHVVVPRLILQPILENAYEHGLKDRSEGGIVKLQFQRSGDKLHIMIEDNGTTLQNERLQWLQYNLQAAGGNLETTGIVNVHRRLQLKYGSTYGIEASYGDMGGLRVIMTIPVSSQEE